MLTKEECERQSMILRDYITCHDEFSILYLMEHYNFYNRLINEYFKLEKALDKACKKLATVIDIEGCNAFCGKYAPDEKCACETKEFWKEYLLNGKDE